MPFVDPAQSGDILKPADIQNHVMVVAPVEYIPSMPTAQGDSQAIRVNVADFSALDQNGQPAIYRGALWFNTMLAGNLKRQIGQYVLGMMTVGQASPGRNAPFQLTPVTDAAWQAHAGNWLDNTPEGDQFQADAVTDQNTAASGAQVAQAAASTPPAPSAPSVPPVPSAPVSAPAAPAMPTAPSLGAPSAPAVPAAPTAGPGASAAGNPGGAPDLAAMLAHLPADQQVAILANMQNQGQASS